MSQTKAQLVSGTTAQDLTVDNINTTSINSGQPSGKRNLVINGAMQLAQRGTSSTSSGIHTVDRFTCEFSGTDEAPEQRAASLGTGDTGVYELGFRKAFKVTNGNQSGGAGASDFINIQHKLEAQDIATSGWNYTSSSSYVTLSFWIKSSVAQSFKGFLRTRDGTEQRYTFDTGSLSADTWTKITKTIPGNSNITINNDNGEGLQINIGAFWGGTYTDNSVTENAWGAYSGSTRMKDNTSTWYTTNDATLEITGVQLEVGSTATDFEHRSFGEELSLCQRYFTKVAYAQASGSGDGSTMASVHARFGVDMRSGPTITASGVLNAQGDNALNSTQSSVHVGTSNFSSPQNMYLVFVQNFSGVVQGRSYVIGLIANNSNQFLADAEL
jgi:hypothetical protein